MIIRKPYAFLIKNFKKIHILLLIIALFVYYKNTQVYSFVREFISLGSYDYYNEPITKYVNIIVIICLLALIIGTTTIIFLLRKKEKPWRLYLLPLIQYFVMLIAFTVIANFFRTYTGAESTATLRVWRDLLMISQIFQFGVFIVFLIRIFGVDLNKFNFKLDEEYLDLEQSDIDEFEISFNVDKSSFKRIYRRTLRNLNYFYQEHKLLCHIALAIIILIIGKNSFDYVLSHRSFKQGDEFKTNNAYTVKVNKSYYSDKSYNGTEISDKSAFVIVDLTITNNAQERKIDLNKYHIINGVNNYITTYKMYETEFKDLGKTYEAVTLKTGEKVNMIMIFKVDKKLKKNRFVLYYQETDRSSEFLRKVKLKINDLSEIEEKASYELGDTMTIPIKDEEENLTFEDYEITPSTDYVYKVCSNCKNTRNTYKAPVGYKVLKLSFASDTFEGKDMTNFAVNYGKIQYINSSNETKEMDMINPIDKTYYGKYLYLRIPDEVAQSESITFNFTVRNNKYIYKIK